MPKNDMKKKYNIAKWGEGFFDVDNEGRLEVSLAQGKPFVQLSEIASKLSNQGLELPVLLRFPNILKQRVRDLTNAFIGSMQEVQYSGQYIPVYPIKVNQHSGVINALNSVQDISCGMEVGSKPELMAVLSRAKPDSLIICNGYKDAEFIKLALIARGMGHRIFIVVEKLNEISLIAKLSKALKVKPLLGVRVRLATLGVGKWQNSGGDKAKFGLTAQQMLQLLEKLRENDLLSSLKLLHFHMGSQIPNIRDIQQGIREGVRFFVELRNMGVNLDLLDIGGGLGVDYEGSKSRNFCSTNYTLQEYAKHVVHTVDECCKEASIDAPTIITEVGRAMTAHHEVLLMQVIDTEKHDFVHNHIKLQDNSPLVLKELHSLLQEQEDRSPVELFHNVTYWLSEAHALFVHGVVDLKHRALAEQLSVNILGNILPRLNPKLEAHRAIFDEVNSKLVNKLFSNFSIFQSVPDVWAINQIFPVLPIEHLNHKSTKRYVIADITCDSDGCFKSYIDGQGISYSIPLPQAVEKNSSILGIFLVGAYQDTLGDKHNLFGKTHSVEVHHDENEGFTLKELEYGDTVADILKEVKFNQKDLLCSYSKQIDNAKLTREQKDSFVKVLEEALDKYTYLSNKN